MTDARWFEIEQDVAAASEHFRRSAEIYGAGGFDDASLDGYKARMALLHAMQSGHTSLESALLRVLDLLGEAAPSGVDWHADLVMRVSRDIAGRPAILSPEVATAAGETRRFRHVAMKSYGSFDIERAHPAVRAAGILARHFGADIAAFKRLIDPSAEAGTP